MVLNTTYFLGLEKTGDAFHFFKLQPAILGLVWPCSRCLAAIVRRIAPLAAPLMVAVVMLVALWIPTDSA
jgi:hypothetical protein